MIDVKRTPSTIQSAQAILRLHRGMIAGTLVVLCAGALGLSLYEAHLREQMPPAAVIGLAGRQRMLAMRVREQVARLGGGQTGDAPLQLSMVEDLAQLEAVHRSLLAVSGGDAAASAALRSADGTLSEFRSAVMGAARIPSWHTQRVLEIAGDRWSEQMDDVVRLLAEQRDARWYELLHLVTAIGVCAGCFVVGGFGILHYRLFRPITRALFELEEQRLHNERLGLVARLTRHAVILNDVSGSIEWVNDAFCRTLGYSLEEVRGKPPSDVLRSADDETRAALERMRTALAAGNGFEERLHCRTHDERELRVAIDCQPLRGGDGQTVGSVAVAADITLTEQLSEKLQRNAERYELALRAGTMGIWEWDAGSGVLSYDEHHDALWGLDPHRQPRGHEDWRRRVHPDDLPQVDSSLRRALQGGENYDVEYRVRGDDGKQRWLHGAGVVMRSADGKPERMVGVNIDVSRRHLMDEKNRELDDRLQRLAEHAPGMLYKLRLSPDGSTSFPYCSVGITQLMGLMPHEVVDDGSRVFAAVHPDDIARVRANLLDAAHSLQSFSDEFRVLKDGQVRWVTAQSTPTRANDGSTDFYGFAADSTEVREANEEVRAVRASLEEAETMARLGSWSFDLASRRIHWSKQMYEIYSRDESLGPPDYAEALAYYADDDRDRLYHAVDDAVQTGLQYTLLLRMKERRNGIGIVRAAGKASRDNRGKVVRLFGTVIDVTSSLEREQALRRAQEQSEAASRAKSDFLANMSHEIRTPMTAILGYVDMLSDAGLTPDEQSSYTKIIQSNAEHLLEIVNQVLDVSKIEAGQLMVESIVCSPDAIAREVVSLMRPRAIAKGLSLSLHFEGLLPATITSDSTRLRQILINLVGNAIKFTDAGTVRLTLALDQREPVPQLSFAVMDTGIGIDEATLQRLFSPFSQGDSSTTRRFGGTGLGLSISRRLVGLLGGTLCVESEAGRGSTFLATIPTGEIGAVVTAATEVVRARRQSRPELGATPALAGRRILVVEDGEDNQRLLAVYLQREGAQVETLANGKLALERLMASDSSDGGASAFDVVLMDMQMPVMDGYTATAALRRWGYRGAIVALTAHALDSDRKRCIDAGCDDYLAKPIDRASLVSMVLGQLDGSPLTPNTQAGRRVSSNMHDDSEMGDLLRAFVASLPGRVAALTAAHRAGDMVELSTLAHQLRGAGGGYGFPTITVAAAGVETEVEAGDVDRLSSSIAQLIETCLAAEAPQKVADRSIPLRPSSESHPFISDRE